jgi:hypothetical protein
VLIGQDFGLVLALEFGERVAFDQASAEFVDELIHPTDVLTRSLGVVSSATTLLGRSHS